MNASLGALGVGGAWGSSPFSSAAAIFFGDGFGLGIAGSVGLGVAWSSPDSMASTIFLGEGLVLLIGLGFGAAAFGTSPFSNASAIFFGEGLMLPLLLLDGLGLGLSSLSLSSSLFAHHSCGDDARPPVGDDAATLDGDGDGDGEGEGDTAPAPGDGCAVGDPSMVSGARKAEYSRPNYPRPISLERSAFHV